MPRSSKRRLVHGSPIIDLTGYLHKLFTTPISFINSMFPTKLPVHSAITVELTRPRGSGNCELIKHVEKQAIAARVQRFVGRRRVFQAPPELQPECCQVRDVFG